MVSLPTRSAFASFIMVVLLVSGSSFAPVGTASAAEQGHCTQMDDFIMFLTLGAVNVEDCSRGAYVQAAVEDMKESDANQSKVDIRSAAQGVAASHEAFVAPMDNYLSDTESVAWMKAEVAIADAYERGLGKEQSKAYARMAIADYYATKQISLIEQWNVTASQWYTLRQQAKQEDGIPTEFVTFDTGPGEDSEDYMNNPGIPANSHTVTKETVTLDLVNGSTHEALRLRSNLTDRYGDHTIKGLQPTGRVFIEDSADWPLKIRGFEVRPPNSNFNELDFVSIYDNKFRWDDVNQMNDDLQAEVGPFVDATWDAFESGQISATDVISSNTAMFEYGVRSGDDEGLYRSAVAISMMGYELPDLNNSGTMTVEYRGQTHTGIVMAKEAPGGAWETGKSYDSANIPGIVFMATSDGQKIDFSDNDPFTITGMTSKDGSQVNSTQTTKYVYKTANTAELLEKQERITELRQEIEDREPSGVGGLPLGSGVSSTDIMIGIGALLGAAVLAQMGRGRMR